jgi:beta-N-acetylhexosaminidase
MAAAAAAALLVLAADSSVFTVPAGTLGTTSSGEIQAVVPSEAQQTRGKYAFERPAGSFSIRHFYRNKRSLDRAVAGIMATLSDREMVSQMVIAASGRKGRSWEQTASLYGRHQVGGIMFIDESAARVRHHAGALKQEAELLGSLPPLIAVDGEPSLIHRKIRGIPEFPGNGSIQSEFESRSVARSIAQLAADLGIHMNFAPVCDFDLNPVIGSRSFGSDQSLVEYLAAAFVLETQKQGVAATAKHFPGHGAVLGDTHESEASVQGVPPELRVFREMIESGVLSIMVGHHEVRAPLPYGTHGSPASMSRSLVTGLLRERLGFEGIVITDALNMGAVREHDFPGVQAVRAGCDIVLMPEDEEQFIERAAQLMYTDKEFRSLVVDSVQRIIRLKLCLGVLESGQGNPEKTG